MQLDWVIVGLLAVWRITHLFALEDGPFDAVLRVRRALGDSAFGRMLDCFNCLSLWVALAVAGVIALTASPPLLWTLLLWPALSGGAVLLQRLAQPAPTGPLGNHESKEI